MIRISLPVDSIEMAQEYVKRVRGIILQGAERAMIGDGTVDIFTDNPVRVVKELADDGFF